MSFIKVTRSHDNKEIIVPMSSVLVMQDNLVVTNVEMNASAVIEVNETLEEIERQLLERELSFYATAGLLANSGGPLQSCSMSGFSTVNCGFGDIYGFATWVAEDGVKAHLNSKKEEKEN